MAENKQKSSAAATKHGASERMHEERMSIQGKEVTLREHGEMAELEFEGTRVHLGKSRGRYSTHLFPFVDFGSAREAADLVVGTHGKLWGPPEQEPVR